MASSTINPPPPISSAPKPTGSKPSGMGRAALIMIVATLLSRLLGLVRDMVIAYQFGQTAYTDVYQAAFRVPDLMTYLIAGGALASTFIPVFSEYLRDRDEEGAWKTFSVLATVTSIVTVLFVVFAEIFTPQLIHLLFSGFGPDQIAYAAHLSRIILPAQLFFMLGGLFMGTLNARNQFLIPSLGPSIYNLGIIFGAFALRPLGFDGLMWGGLIGALIGNFLLQIFAVSRAGMRFRPSFDVRSPGAMKIWKMMLPIVLGVSLPNVDQLITGSFASHLPAGAVSALNTMSRIMLIPIGIFGQATAIAIFPSISAHAAAKRFDQFRTATQQGLRTILFLTIPASALVFVLAVPVITVLFERGKYGAFDTLFAAPALQFYALGIFAWSAQAIITRSFYALQDSRTPVISGTVMTVLFIAMSWFVVHMTNWGIGGLALATSISAMLHGLVMIVLLHRRIGGFLNRDLILSLVRILLATAALTGAAIGVNHLMGHALPRVPTTLSSLLQIAAAGLAGVFAFVAAASLLRMPELREAMKLVRRGR